MIEDALQMARAHAPMLVLAFLLGGAALALATPHRLASWTTALLAALGAAAAAFDLAGRRLAGEALSVNGGLTLSVDGVTAFAAALIAGLAALVLTSAPAASGASVSRAAPHVMALVLTTAAGWIGALLAADFTGVVVGAQIGWLSSVALVAASAQRERGGVNGALRMWSAGGASSALMLTGLALVAFAVGSAGVAAAMSAHIEAHRVATLGYALLIAPLALYAGVAPLHAWAGAAYGRAGELAVLSVGVVTAIGALSVLARLVGIAASDPIVSEGLSAALVVLGVASVVFGAIQAVGAANVRRMVAYAGATQAGCVLLALALGSPAGFAAALIQMVAWSAAALALLSGAGAARGAGLDALDGLIRRAPFASVAITAGALSLMGAPLTIGFLGRWRLIEASVGAGWWWAMGAAITASLAAVFYGGRLIERIYFRRANTTLDLDADAWRFARIPALLAALLAIAMGVAPDVLLQAASRAAALALGHGA